MNGVCESRDVRGNIYTTRGIRSTEIIVRGITKDLCHSIKIDIGTPAKERGGFRKSVMHLKLIDSSGKHSIRYRIDTTSD